MEPIFNYIILRDEDGGLWKVSITTNGDLLTEPFIIVDDPIENN